MESDKSVQKYGHINYKTKLLGIAPRHCNFNTRSPWEIENIKVCKKPSQYTEGKLLVSDDATLIETGIVEKRIDLTSEFDNTNVLSPISSHAANVSHADGIYSDKSESRAEYGMSTISPMIEKKESTISPNYCIEPNSGPIEISTDSRDESLENVEGKEHHREKAITKFITQCFNNLKASTPDFISDRRLLCYIAVEDESYVIKAQKRFITSDDGEHELKVIDLSFLDRPNSSNDIGLDFAKWATRDEDTTSQSLNKLCVSEESQPLDEAQIDNEKKVSTEVPYHPYHHAFIEGELSKNGFNKATKFSILMSAQISGVWKLEDNPENYTCSHLAEVKTANVNTVKSHVFYKNVRMRQNWIKAHLAGKTNYMVGINKKDSLDRSFIKELILYDVEKVPGAILIAAKEHEFDAWTPDSLHRRLFTALEFIHGTMKDSKADEECVFIHYDKSDHLFYDQNESLLKEYIQRKRTVTISNVPESRSHLTPIEDTIAQLQIIMKCIEYSPNQPFPEFVRDYNDIILTFTEPKLADSFSLKVTLYWKLKKNIPTGFERMFVSKTKVFEPRPLSGKYVRLESLSRPRYATDKGRQQYNNENRYYDLKRNWRN